MRAIQPSNDCLQHSAQCWLWKAAAWIVAVQRLYDKQDKRRGGSVAFASAARVCVPQRGRRSARGAVSLLPKGDEAKGANVAFRSLCA